MTRRSDPLPRRVRAFCRQLELRGTLVLCALSGGRDSMALLRVLSELKCKIGRASCRERV